MVLNDSRTRLSLLVDVLSASGGRDVPSKRWEWEFSSGKEIADKWVATKL